MVTGARTGAHGAKAVLLDVPFLGLGVALHS